MVNNTERIGAINKRKTFKGINSLAFYNGNNEYIIMSYDTVIYSDVKGLDYKYYSHTTRILQNIIKSAMNYIWEDITV